MRIVWVASNRLLFTWKRDKLPAKLVPSIYRDRHYNGTMVQTQASGMMMMTIIVVLFRPICHAQSLYSRCIRFIRNPPGPITIGKCGGKQWPRDNFSRHILGRSSDPDAQAHWVAHRIIWVRDYAEHNSTSIYARESRMQNCVLDEKTESLNPCNDYIL